MPTDIEKIILKQQHYTLKRDGKSIILSSLTCMIIVISVWLLVHFRSMKTNSSFLPPVLPLGQSQDPGRLSRHSSLLVRVADSCYVQIIKLKLDILMHTFGEQNKKIKKMLLTSNVVHLIKLLSPSLSVRFVCQVRRVALHALILKKHELNYAR